MMSRRPREQPSASASTAVRKPSRRPSPLARSCGRPDEERGRVKPLARGRLPHARRVPQESRRVGIVEERPRYQDSSSSGMPLLTRSVAAPWRMQFEPKQRRLPPPLSANWNVDNWFRGLQNCPQSVAQWIVAAGVLAALRSGIGPLVAFAHTGFGFWRRHDHEQLEIPAARGAIRRWPRGPD